MSDVDIAVLPDSLWLHIFTYLEDAVHVALIARVCRRLYRVSRDPRLWHRVYIKHVCSVTRLWAFIRQPIFAKHVRCLHVRGNLRERKPITKRKRPAQTARHEISNAFVCSLAHHCPHLVELHLLETCLRKSGVSVGSLPNTIVHLSLQRTEIDFDFFAEQEGKWLPDLKGLDLGWSVNLSSVSKSIPAILKRTDFTYLNLSGCVKVSAEHLRQISQTMLSLRELRLARLRVSHVNDELLFAIAANLKSLETLDVSFCDAVSDAGVLALTKSQSLCELDVSYTAVSDRSLSNITHSTFTLVHLRHLTVGADELATVYKQNTRLRVVPAPSIVHNNHTAAAPALEENEDSQSQIWHVPVTIDSMNRPSNNP